MNGNCSSGFTQALASADDAFPGVAPRPVAPNLIMRSFTLASPVTATHVRLVVDTSQCTGGPAYAGEQDSDPTNATDCATQSSHASEVRAAELEVYGSPGSVGQPRDGDPRASYALVDIDGGTVTFRRARYDVAETQRRIRARGLPDLLADRLASGF